MNGEIRNAQCSQFQRLTFDLHLRISIHAGTTWRINLLKLSHMLLTIFRYHIHYRIDLHYRANGRISMNNEQRIEFWNVLCSLKGENPEADQKQLQEKIVLPRYLFRYRSVNSNNLDALRTNRLYFSSANYYDDPFDTFLHIDFQKIKNEFESNFQSDAAIEQLAIGMKHFISGHENELPEVFVNAVTDPSKLKTLPQNGLINAFLSYVMDVRNEIRKNTWSVCFSENGLNETLWLKYADQYKGYALVYDLDNTENLRCGKMDKCKNCGILQYGTPLYPVAYSNEPYDATSFARFVLGQKLSQQVNFPLPPFLQADLSKGITPWEREKTTLLKKMCHQYDEEWRMILPCPMNPPIMREWVPAGIILGLRMNPSEKNLVITLAKEAGIAQLYESYINIDNKLDIRSLPAENRA